MKFLVSELGLCIVFGIVMVVIISGFVTILQTVTV